MLAATQAALSHDSRMRSLLLGYALSGGRSFTAYGLSRTGVEGGLKGIALGSAQASS